MRWWSETLAGTINRMMLLIGMSVLCIIRCIEMVKPLLKFAHHLSWEGDWKVIREEDFTLFFFTKSRYSRPISQLFLLSDSNKQREKKRKRGTDRVKREKEKGSSSEVKYDLRHTGELPRGEGM